MMKKKAKGERHFLSDTEQGVPRNICSSSVTDQKRLCSPCSSRVAQWKRAGPKTQRFEDQNLALLVFCFYQKECRFCTDQIKGKPCNWRQTRENALGSASSKSNDILIYNYIIDYN